MVRGATSRFSGGGRSLVLVTAPSPRGEAAPTFRLGSSAAAEAPSRQGQRASPGRATARQRTGRASSAGEARLGRRGGAPGGCGAGTRGVPRSPALPLLPLSSRRFSFSVPFAPPSLRPGSEGRENQQEWPPPRIPVTSSLRSGRHGAAGTGPACACAWGRVCRQPGAGGVFWKERRGSRRGWGPAHPLSADPGFPSSSSAEQLGGLGPPSLRRRWLQVGGTGAASASPMGPRSRRWRSAPLGPHACRACAQTEAGPTPPREAATRAQGRRPAGSERACLWAQPHPWPWPIGSHRCGSWFIPPVTRGERRPGICPQTPAVREVRETYSL